jgi:hypothetical protein
MRFIHFGRLERSGTMRARAAAARAVDTLECCDNGRGGPTHGRARFLPLALVVVLLAVSGSLAFAGSASADYLPGLVSQPAGTCNASIGNYISVPVPTFRGLNVTSGRDSQRFRWTLYLRWWDGANWRYALDPYGQPVKDAGWEDVGEGGQANWITNWSAFPHSIFYGLVNVPQRGYFYSVLAIAEWQSLQTGQYVNRQIYQVPMDNGFSYCNYK